MNGLGFSLKWLLAVVTFVAVGLTALFNASAVWATVISVVTTVLLLTAILGAIYCRDRGRAFAVGCCVFGWGYLLLAYAPQPYSRIVATTSILEYLGDTLQRTEPVERDLSALTRLERHTLQVGPGLSSVYVVNPMHVKIVASFFWRGSSLGWVAFWLVILRSNGNTKIRTLVRNKAMDPQNGGQT